MAIHGANAAPIAAPNATPNATPIGAPEPGGRRADVRDMRVLRISHNGVVPAWRARERELRALGVDLTLATAKRWNEGGKMLSLRQGRDPADTPKLFGYRTVEGFAVGVRTFGRHPNLFVFDPKPIWRLLGSRRWDLLDFHEEPFSLAIAELLLLRALRSKRTPFVFYSAQNIKKRYPLPFSLIERRALKEAAGAYVCNIEAGEILESKGLKSRSVVLPLGVSLEQFQPTDREPPNGKLHIGYVGRLEAHKGVDVLLRAIKDDPQMCVQIFGDGPEATNLRHLASSLDLGDRAIFRGFASPGDIPDVYKGFDVLAVPSIPTRSWIEQFCRVAVEAIASGVPVVASDTGALPEVVGRAGILVGPGEPKALHDGLRQLLDSPDTWQRLRTIGLGSIGRFSWKNVASGQLDLYKTAIKS